MAPSDNAHYQVLIAEQIRELKAAYEQLRRDIAENFVTNSSLQDKLKIIELQLDACNKTLEAFAEAFRAYCSAQDKKEDQEKQQQQQKQAHGWTRFQMISGFIFACLGALSGILGLIISLLHH